MSYLGTKSFGELQEKDKVILPFQESRLKSGAYELSLGSEVFRTDSKDKKKEILKENKEQVQINPGQFALLLTDEVLNIPLDKIAFISIKAKIKLRGLVNVSGFHVDPGFKGKLVFSVYNAGSSQISLEKGEPCFLIWLAELSEKEKETYNGEHKNQDNIPLRYVDDLTQEDSELASPNALLKKINDNQKELIAKIGLIEKDQTAKDYLIKTAVGLGIIILFKFAFDWFAYDNGFKKGIELKQKEILNDSIINKLILEKKTLLLEIDSLNKIKADTTK